MLALATLLVAATHATVPMGPHAAALAAHRAGRGVTKMRREAPPPPPPPTEGPSSTVYGYWPYWGDDLDTIAWDGLSHIAIFGVELESDGSLSGTHHWTDVAAQAVQLGATYDVEVHLCLIGFEDDVHADVFPSAARRARAISELVELIDAYGADGVNVDIEGLDGDLKDDFTTFIQELRAETDALYIATPSVDWSSAYDYDELAAASDGLFIMAYGYHHSSGNPGPNSPLTGGGPWSSLAIDDSVEDYRDNGAPDGKIIVGLPLYGRNWPSTDNSVPGTATEDGSSVTWVTAIEQGDSYGRLWDTVTSTPYAFPDSTHQLWYDDHESIEAKIGWSLDQGLQGVGFWALTYEDADPALWSMIDALANPPAPDDTDRPDDTDTDSEPGTDTGTDRDPPGIRGVDGRGCGCSSAGSGLGALPALLGLLGLARRRRG